MTCLLCQKIASCRTTHADELIVELSHSVVFLGPWQYYEGYCIVTARQHYTELFQLPPTVRHELMDEVARVAQAIHTVVQPRKINYEWLGNQVPHLHWHLFPRQASDPHHLQAAWLDIASAEQDVTRKDQWQHCARGKETLIRQLQEAIQ
jgi:diadenosine tetraphosphate (Ap4A) HIT family hydrolase